MSGRRRFRIPGVLVLTAALASLGASGTPAQAGVVSGKLTGVVRDTAGTPQMGASVQIVAEGASSKFASPLQEHLTNTLGIFRGESLSPGLYAVRVTLAGFLPTLEQHVRVAANVTTMVRIEMESMFASLDRLRHQPTAPTDTDDWKWVLRSSAAMRPVLQWVEDGQRNKSESSTGAGVYPHARLELTSGARRLGSVANEADSAGTAFAYDQKLGGTSRLLLAGQMSYERAPAGGIAAVWLPSGSLGAGPQTTLVVREAKLGWEGRTFRGMRLAQNGAVDLGDRATVRYGAEYVFAGLDRAVSSLRPRLEADVRLGSEWRVAVVFAAQPSAPALLDGVGSEDGGAPLLAALNELHAFPTLLWRGGRPVLEAGWHEELAAERKMGGRGRLQIAAFHDDNQHVAVFGRSNGEVSGTDFFRDFFSDALAYDGGSSASWGARAGLREKLNDNVELTAVYTFAGALAPRTDATARPGDGDVRGALQTQQRHAVTAGVRARMPRLRTQVDAGYQWISGLIVSRLDNYGEILFQSDPFLHVSVRQRLPKFGPGQWEALAQCENLLAQGYVPMNGRDGSVVFVPAFRTFRGGLSVQF